MTEAEFKEVPQDLDRIMQDVKTAAFSLQVALEQYKNAGGTPTKPMAYMLSATNLFLGEARN